MILVINEVFNPKEPMDFFDFTVVTDNLSIRCFSEMLQISKAVRREIGFGGPNLMYST